MRCEHEHDDGAYVLGALSPAERTAYERHLATCSFCREAVADIAVLPGLLGRLDPADFARLLDPTLSPSLPNRAPRLPGTLQTTRRRERKKVRVRVLSGILAAAVVALIVGAGAMFVMSQAGSVRPPGDPAVAMTSVDKTIPISAQIELDSATGGTKVKLVCLYTKNSPSLKPYTVRLVAYGADEEDEQLGSWVAVPGKEFSMAGVTHFTAGTLSRLALVRNNGQTLLEYDVP